MNQNGGVTNMGKIKIELNIDGEKVLGRKTQSDDVTVGELCVAVAQLEIIKMTLLSEISAKNKEMGVRLKK